MIDSLRQDLRYGVRGLMRAPAFTAVAVLSLALGTGAATALFSLVNTVTLKPLAYREPGHLLFIREVVPPLAHIYPTMPANFQHYRFWREHSEAFESLAAVYWGGKSLVGGEQSELAGSATVSANLFDTLGVRPAIGRGFLAEEERPGKVTPVIISHSFWQRRFGGAPDVAGRTIVLDGAACTIVGVLPASFHFPKKGDLGPLTGLAERTDIFLPVQHPNDSWSGEYDYIVFGRLRHGVAPAQGIAELNLFQKRIAAEHALNAGQHVEARPLQDVIASPARTGLAVLLSAVLLLVLIVCVNLASLLLARGSARMRELALRIALGASRRRLLVAAALEAVLLSAAGGALGVLAARAALATFVHAAPVDLPRIDEVQLDGRVLLFAFGLSLACGLLFGLLPALRLSRIDPQIALRSQSQSVSAGRQGLRLREWLVGSEVALSTLLLVLAGLLASSLWHVLRVDRGFTDNGTIDFAVTLPPAYNAPKDRVAFFDQAAERLRAVPGVRAVAVASRVPLTGESSVNGVQLPGGQSALDPLTRQAVMVNDRFIGQDYFAALGIPLLRGRAIEAADRDRNVAVVSARLAAKLWPGQDPLGKVLSSGGNVHDAQVVGIVGDVHSTHLERDPTLMVYVPFWRIPWAVPHIVVRPVGEPGAIAQEAQHVLQSIAPGMPTPTVHTMGEIVAESMAQRRFQMSIAAAFGIAALLLAALGIYGVVAYGVSLRRREFGIRMALGARVAGVCRLVLWRGLRPVAFGLAAGLGGAVAAGRLVRSMLFGVSPDDAATLTAVGLVLACVAALACLLPARGVLHIDPARVLRDE
jgi:putative ABC transport system permease protein